MSNYTHSPTFQPQKTIPLDLAEDQVVKSKLLSAAYANRAKADNLHKQLLPLLQLSEINPAGKRQNPVILDILKKATVCDTWQYVISNLIPADVVRPFTIFTSDRNPALLNPLPDNIHLLQPVPSRQLAINKAYSSITSTKARKFFNHFASNLASLQAGLNNDIQKLEVNFKVDERNQLRQEEVYLSHPLYPALAPGFALCKYLSDSLQYLKELYRQAEEKVDNTKQAETLTVTHLEELIKQYYETKQAYDRHDESWGAISQAVFLRLSELQQSPEYEPESEWQDEQYVASQRLLSEEHKKEDLLTLQNRKLKARILQVALKLGIRCATHPDLHSIFMWDTDEDPVDNAIAQRSILRVTKRDSVSVVTPRHETQSAYYRIKLPSIEHFEDLSLYRKEVEATKMSTLKAIQDCYWFFIQGKVQIASQPELPVASNYFECVVQLFYLKNLHADFSKAYETNNYDVRTLVCQQSESDVNDWRRKIRGGVSSSGELLYLDYYNRPDAASLPDTSSILNLQPELPNFKLQLKQELEALHARYEAEKLEIESAYKAIIQDFLESLEAKIIQISKTKYKLEAEAEKLYLVTGSNGHMVRTLELSERALRERIVQQSRVTKIDTRSGIETRNRIALRNECRSKFGVSTPIDFWTMQCRLLEPCNYDTDFLPGFKFEQPEFRWLGLFSSQEEVTQCMTGIISNQIPTETLELLDSAKLLDETRSVRDSFFHNLMAFKLIAKHKLGLASTRLTRVTNAAGDLIRILTVQLLDSYLAPLLEDSSVVYDFSNEFNYLESVELVYPILQWYRDRSDGVSTCDFSDLDFYIAADKLGVAAASLILRSRARSGKAKKYKEEGNCIMLSGSRYVMDFACHARGKESPLRTDEKGCTTPEITFRPAGGARVPDKLEPTADLMLKLHKLAHVAITPVISIGNMTTEIDWEGNISVYDFCHMMRLPKLQNTLNSIRLIDLSKLNSSCRLINRSSKNFLWSLMPTPDFETDRGCLMYLLITCLIDSIEQVVDAEASIDNNELLERLGVTRLATKIMNIEGFRPIAWCELERMWSSLKQVSNYQSEYTVTDHPSEEFVRKLVRVVVDHRIDIRYLIGNAKGIYSGTESSDKRRISTARETLWDLTDKILTVLSRSSDSETQPKRVYL